MKLPMVKNTRVGPGYLSKALDRAFVVEDRPWYERLVARLAE